MPPMPNWTSRRLVVAIFFSLILSGCGSDTGFVPADFVPAEGSVQFVNMMSDSPEVTILHGLNQFRVRYPVAVPIEVRFVDRYDWRIAYLNSQNQEITVAQADDQQILESTLTTFLFMGTLRNANIQIVDYAVLPFEERPDGLAEMWFASNITNFAMVDIYVTAYQEDLATQTPLTTLTSGTYSELISVPSGTQRQLRITPAGSNTLLFDSGPIEIPEKSRDLIALVDDFGFDSEAHVDVIRSLTVAGTIISDFSQPATGRIGNYSSTAFINANIGDVAFTGVSQSNRSGYLQTGIGDQNLTVESGAGDLLEQSTQRMRTGSIQSVYTFDNPDSATQPATRSLTLIETPRPIIDRALFKFANGSNQTIDLYVLAGGQTPDNTGPLLNNLTFQGSGTTESLAQEIDFLVTTADGSQELAQLTATLLEGENYTLLFDNDQVLQLVRN